MHGRFSREYFMSELDYQAAVEFVQGRINQIPVIGLVLGSGMGGLADEISAPVIIPYEEIPHWPVSTVPGHSGRLVIGELEGVPVIAQQGRAHFYEGYTIKQVTFPIRVMHLLGVKSVVLTNAAGGLNPNFSTGDVMLITDHINLPGMVGNNPLMGPNDESIGPRFPGMTHTYDREYRKLAHNIAQNVDVDLQTGV